MATKMSDPNLPPPPQHREKLLDLSTGKTVSTGDVPPNAANTPESLTTASAPTEAAESEQPADISMHVSPIGENWEVESEAATLGQADSKAEAEELAKALGEQMGADKVT